MDSPFDVLGIDEDAEEGEIEDAYRDRVKATHPDQGGSLEEFHRVQTAYDSIKSDEVDLWTPASTRKAGSEVAQDSDAAPDQPETAHVEYLNYAVLDDYGWSVDDESLFERANAADLGPPNYGEMEVQPGESLLEAAEARGFAWPYACRGGACANCAVIVVDGELSLPTDHILPEEMTERGIRLSCNGRPTTESMQVLFNVKYLADLEELRLPPYPFELAMADD